MLEEIVKRIPACEAEMKTNLSTLLYSDTTPTGKASRRRIIRMRVKDFLQRARDAWDVLLGNASISDY